jgi:hypothetical protein
LVIVVDSISFQLPINQLPISGQDSSSGASFSADTACESDEHLGLIEENDLVLGECYMQDLRLCQQDDPHLFCFLLPFVYGRYLMPSFMCNNSELVYLICSCVDARQLKDLIASVSSYEMTLVKQFNSVEASLGRKSTRGANSSLQSSTGNKKVIWEALCRVRFERFK